MNSIRLKYGIREISLKVSDRSSIDTILPPITPSEKPGLEVVQNALQNPISAIDFAKLHAARTVAIAINDKTRPVPYGQILPPLLDFLSSHDISPSQITYLVATGTHTPLTTDEMDVLLPSELRRKSAIISHDCDQAEQLVPVGQTPAGTFVELNRIFHEADYKIVLGSIEPHHFMGYSGGVKTAAIGLTSRLSIRQNHAHLISPLSTTGNHETNPCRLDVEEMGKLIKVDLAINILINTQKEIVRALVGHPVDVIQTGIPFSQKISQVEIKHLYDLAIVSPGGYPKDINFYQAHKAVTNAASLTRDGGRVILLAECIEGPGSRPFQEFMKGISSPGQVLEKFNQIGFEIGPHKAFLLARQLNRIQVSLLSSMSDEITRSLLLDPITVEDIQSLILEEQRKKSKIAILPYGVNTVPLLR
jgi:nickel-dependent lactate racemase